MEDSCNENQDVKASRDNVIVSLWKMISFFTMAHSINFELNRYKRQGKFFQMHLSLSIRSINALLFVLLILRLPESNNLGKWSVNKVVCECAM